MYIYLHAFILVRIHCMYSIRICFFPAFFSHTVALYRARRCMGSPFVGSAGFSSTNLSFAPSNRWSSLITHNFLTFIFSC